MTSRVPLTRPHTPAYIRPGLNSPSGSKAALTPRVSRASGGGQRLRTRRRAARSASGARTSVAWPPSGASAARTAAASAGVGSLASQTRPPPQSRYASRARGAEPGEEVARARGLEVDPPDRALARLGEELGVADRAPQALRIPRRAAHVWRRSRRAARAAARCGSRPNRRNLRGAGTCAANSRPMPARDRRRAADAEGRAERRRHRCDRVRVVEPADDQRRLGSRARAAA